MNNMEDIEILCRHLSEKMNISIKFEENATPSTNGEIIVLPTNLNKQYLYELLAILLHETAHILYTDMNVFNNSLNILEKNKGVYISGEQIYKLPVPISKEVLNNIINVLEDIRIDTLVLKKYPQASELYYLLFKYTTQKYLDGMKKEPKPMRILKHLILMSRNMDLDVKDFYYDEEALKIINEKHLNTFIIKAKNKSKIEQIIPLAYELFLELREYLKNDEEIAESINKQEEELKKQIKELNEKFNKKLEENNKSLEELKQVNQERDELSNTEGDIRRKIRNKRDIISRRDAELKYNIKLTAEEKEKLSKSLTRALRELQSAEQELNQLQADNKIKKLNEKRNQKNTEYEQNLHETAKIRQEQTNLETSLIDNMKPFFDNGIDILGFGAIDKKDLINNDIYSNIKLQKSLDETLKDFFVIKKEERFNTDEAYRINKNKIYKIFTNENNIYTDNHFIEHKTRLTFLLDCSGSMNDFGNYDNEGSYTILISTIKTLLESLNRIIKDEGIPLEISIYAFDDFVYELKKFDEEINMYRIIEGCRPKGGTRLLKSINEMSKKFEETGDEAENILFVLTDAKVNDYTINELANQTYDNMKVHYIGINVTGRVRHELFQYNITSTKELISVLIKLITSK